jgi:hypothetical protein
MRRTAMISTVVALMLGAMAVQTNAQTMQCGVASFHTLKNATPIVKLASCYGVTGYCGCGPGWVSSCVPNCCHCVRCG